MNGCGRRASLVLLAVLVLTTTAGIAQASGSGRAKLVVHVLRNHYPVGGAEVSFCRMGSVRPPACRPSGRTNHSGVWKKAGLRRGSYALFVQYRMPTKAGGKQLCSSLAIHLAPRQRLSKKVEFNNPQDSCNA